MANLRHRPRTRSARRPKPRSAAPSSPAVYQVEALITIAHARGLRINNLFEIADGWRANLTDGRLFYEFGEGASPSAALQAALERARAERGP